MQRSWCDKPSYISVAGVQPVQLTLPHSLWCIPNIDKTCLMCEHVLRFSWWTGEVSMLYTFIIVICIYFQQKKSIYAVWISENNFGKSKAVVVTCWSVAEFAVSFYSVNLLHGIRVSHVMGGAQRCHTVHMHKHSHLGLAW